MSLLFALPSSAIQITLDYSLDKNNLNWFGGSEAGSARRAAVDSAAAFLSAIITNDDWNAISIPGENLTFSDINLSSLSDFSGDLVEGTPESDGAGWSYSLSVNNRLSVAANEYVIYVGALPFDNGTTAHAKASWDSSDRRNAAGFAGEEFNTWGGKIYFDTGDSWYAGWNPGLNPTDNYGTQDANKNPPTDITSDNWDWSFTTDTWKGFDLRSLDTGATGLVDLYATALHEMIHALGATESNFASYISTNALGDLTGENLMAEYGGPVPADDDSGHFVENLQSVVWNSPDIVSEVSLDPNSLRAVRKYLTRLDAALLRDLGYQVREELSVADFDGDGLVDHTDLELWRTSYSTSSLADANGDLASTGADFLLWQRLATVSASQTVAAAVPEPDSYCYFCFLFWLLHGKCLAGAQEPAQFDAGNSAGSSKSNRYRIWL